MPDSFQIVTTVPAAPQQLYEAWLSSQEHSAFTGSDAEIEPKVGGRHRAWGDYISGRILELEAGRRIVMTWRTSEFPPASPDSRLEIQIEADGKGTRLLLLHSRIPDGDGPKYEEGWRENYFAPMQSYFRKKIQQGSKRPGSKVRAGGKAKKSRKAARRT